MQPKELSLPLGAKELDNYYSYLSSKYEFGKPIEDSLLCLDQEAEISQSLRTLPFSLSFSTDFC